MVVKADNTRPFDLSSVFNNLVFISLVVVAHDKLIFLYVQNFSSPEHPYYFLAFIQLISETPGLLQKGLT